MSRRVFVSGVGMIPFVKPGASASYDVMGEQAGRLALSDAGIDYADLQQLYAGYVYGDSTSGQKASYRLGMTGIPVINVNNNCSTGSTALFLARQAIASGAADCVLALGFEQMAPGALGTVFKDRPSPFDDFDRETDQLVGMPEIPLALRYFGGAGLSQAGSGSGSDPAIARGRRSRSAGSRWYRAGCKAGARATLEMNTLAEVVELADTLS